MTKLKDDSLDRRNFLKIAAAGAAAAGISGLQVAGAQNSAPTQLGKSADAGMIKDVCGYIARGATAELPGDVVEKMKHHILDTFGAIISGSTLKPGQLALKHVQSQGGNAEAQVVTAKLVTSAINAAFANGMMAHADETDDTHRRTLMHPGASIVPAALALAEKQGADGKAFLKSVVVGYDIGCRMILALDPDQLLQGSGATPGIGGCFGAAAACAAIAGVDERLIPNVLTYAVQQASGINSWMRDTEHVEKAFVFAGMPARNGVTATELVQAGFTSEPDPFSGTDNFFKAFSGKADPTRLTAGMGREYEVMLTDLKSYAAGAPIQAPTDAILKLIARGLTPKDIKTLTVRLPAPGVRTVNDREMPDVNVQYVLAATLIDGKMNFQTSHSPERMKDPAVLDVKRRIILVEDTELTAQKRTREANLEVVKTDGTILTEHGITKGAIENPMTREEVEKKAMDLMTPVLGHDRAERLVEKIWNLEMVKNMRELRPLLSA
jgi:2-methylcitrate dehydratase PrpD